MDFYSINPVYKRNVLKWHKNNDFSIGCLNCAAIFSEQYIFKKRWQGNPDVYM